MASPKRSRALVPSAKDLALLTPEKVQMVLDTINSEGDRELTYASLSMRCGVVCLLGSLGFFTYLVMNGHDKAAGIVFGTSVVGLLGKIVLARL